MTSKYLALAALGVAALAACADEGKTDRPEPARKGDRWEYAELHYTPARAARAAKGAWGNGPNGFGGPAQPAPAAVAVTKASVRWITNDGETEGEGWDGLAAKLKAPAAGKDAKAVAHKVKLLNHLGREGWELVSTDGSTWTFKRKVAK